MAGTPSKAGRSRSSGSDPVRARRISNRHRCFMVSPVIRDAESRSRTPAGPLGRVDEFMEFWTIVLCRCSSENIHGPPLPRGQACAYSSAMLCGRQSNPCSGNSSTPPAARRGSATGCSSKLSCTKPAPGPLGGDLPDEFGHWNGVYHRFRRWEKGGLWERLWHRFQHIDDDPLSELFIDSTVVRAHQHATGASKKTVGNKPRLWAALRNDRWVLHQAARGLHGRAYRGVVRVDWWTAQ